MSLLQIAVIAVAFVVAGIAKGAIGMGMPPIAIGLMSFAMPLTRKTLAGFVGVAEFQLEGQRNLESQNGLCVIEKTRRQLIQIRHGVTTDPTDLLTREWSIIGQQDAMVYRLRDYLESANLIGQPIYPYTLVNVEGEYAFGYTKISGEWTHDRFDTPTGEREARGATLQVKQTLTPRIYVHTRATAITSPVTIAATGEVPDRTSWYADTTAGYLVNADTTVRLAHAAIKRWNVPSVDHQIGLSIVWARRWW